MRLLLPNETQTGSGIALILDYATAIGNAELIHVLAVVATATMCKIKYNLQKKKRKGRQKGVNIVKENKYMFNLFNYGRRSGSNLPFRSFQSVRVCRVNRY